MSRHRTVRTPRQRVRSAVVWAARAVGWLVAGAVVGAVTLLAMRWAGTEPGFARRIGLVVAVVSAAAVGVGTSAPWHRRADEGTGIPPES